MDSWSELLEFRVTATPYDASYTVSNSTRATTNFANLARDPTTRRRNIGTFLDQVDRDLNLLLADDPQSARSQIRLAVLTLSCRVVGDPAEATIPLTEVMRAAVRDTLSGVVHDGPVGLNFSSYLRDYDFRVVLPELLARNASGEEMAGFGALHGWLTRIQFGAGGVIPEPLTVAISISQSCEYQATAFTHPLLGRQYQSLAESLTDGYFRQMGLRPYFFRPVMLPAPMAIYSDDSLLDRSEFYLAALVAVMGNFQRIYRPEIYLSRVPFSAVPGESSRASLANADYGEPPIHYDRGERELLSQTQARLIYERLLVPHADVVDRLRILAGREARVSPPRRPRVE